MVAKSADGNDKFSVKVFDFGFSKRVDPFGERISNEVVGTPIFLAPEVILRLKYNAKADTWSIGILLFKLLMGKYPFGNPE